VNILSIQSWVSYGHVGNAAAVFPLQRLGAEVWAVNTVQFSNHTGYGDWAGPVMTAADIAGLLAGLDRRGALATADAVLSGYLGDVAIGEAILGAVAQMRAARPDAVYCCDPVIGDDGKGVYVRPGIADWLRDQALPAADVATPNQFELGYLTGLPCTTVAQVRLAVRALQARMHGRRCVLVTSVQTEATPTDSIDMLAAEGDGLYLLRTERLPLTVNGAGDLVAALFLFHLLATGSAADALATAGASLAGVLRQTAAAGGGELRIIAAQSELISPSRFFPILSY
jgi:pyridoxine kinase